MPDFSPATAAWFDSAFEGPTAAQEGAWAAIGAGSDTLVIAPTGSGKTLAAFLWALDQLASSSVDWRVVGGFFPKKPPPTPRHSTRGGPGPLHLTVEGTRG